MRAAMRSAGATLLLALPIAFTMPAGAIAADCPGNANALGVSRTVEIDTTGGPGFGLEQYKAYDFLQPGEVILTFDDGPWPTNTRKVLKALADHCTKATFFIIGKHATYHPHILKEVALAGHTIGSHTWSHANLNKGSRDKAKAEFEKGLSAIKAAAGQAPSSFFRFPYLQDPDEIVSYLGTRNIAIFSMDLDSFDFKWKKPSQVVKIVMGKLKKKGKGIILMHDFQKATANAMPQLLKELKKGGYKVVHMVSKAPASTLPEFDEAVKSEIKGPVGTGQPVSSVVKTITPTQ